MCWIGYTRLITEQRKSSSTSISIWIRQRKEPEHGIYHRYKLYNWLPSLRGLDQGDTAYPKSLEPARSHTGGFTNILYHYSTLQYQIRQQMSGSGLKPLHLELYLVRARHPTSLASFFPYSTRSSGPVKIASLRWPFPRRPQTRPGHRALARWWRCRPSSRSPSCSSRRRRQTPPGHGRPPCSAGSD